MAKNNRASEPLWNITSITICVLSEEKGMKIKMKNIGVIPARYNSTRFQGKPLAEIDGKPMVWHVYQQALKVENLTEVYVATDDQRIIDVCNDYEMKVLKTADTHSTMSARIHEVSTMIDADSYIVINGDEPLIDPNVINKVIPTTKEGFYAQNLMTPITQAADVIDATNIKVVFNENRDAVYMSRAPIPFPKGRLDFKYFKHLGVVAYSKEALEFYINTPKTYYESVEDIDYLRLIENKKSFKMIEVVADTISVDSPKDLEMVRALFLLNKKSMH